MNGTEAADVTKAVAAAPKVADSANNGPLTVTSANIGPQEEIAEPSPPSESAPNAPTPAADPAPTAAPAASAAPASPTGVRPPADRQPTRPGDAEKISFDDLNLGIQADVVYRPFMLTDRAKELDGKRVSIVGYMHGGVESTRGVKEFVLLRNTECKFGPGGQADHLAQVYLAPGETTAFEKKPVKVEGRLKIEPFVGVDGNTWSIYRLEDAQIQ
jgi:hypothetical protein